MQLKLGAALVAVTLLIHTTTSCQWSEDRTLDREVVPEELVGSWVLRPESVQNLNSIGIKIVEGRFFHELEFDADGGCRLRTFLPEDVQLTGPPPAVTSSKCRWTLGQGAAHQRLSIALLDAPEKTIRYRFTEANGGELVIWQYIGDPDAWRYLEYSKSLS